MRNKLLFLLLITVSSANAAEITWVNAFPLYVYGDVSFFSTTYEFVKSVVTSGFMNNVLNLGFFIATLVAGFRARNGGYIDIGKHIAAPITLYALFVVPTVNVHIVDLRVDKGIINYNTPDGGYKKVDDVPYALAAVPASVSLLVSTFIDAIDDNWNSVDLGSRFSTLGFQGISNLSKEALVAADLRDINSSKDGTLYNINEYTKVCLIREGLKKPVNKQILIHPSKPFPEMFNPANYQGNLGNKVVTFTDANGTTDSSSTCSQLYTKYVANEASNIEDEMNELFKKKNGDKIDPTNTELNQAFRDQIGDATGVIGTIGKAMATTAASRVLEKDLNTEGIGVNGVSMATELSIDSTMANLRTEGTAKFTWLTRVLPDAINIVLAIMIGAFPFMVLVMSFFGKNGLMGVTNYFMGYMAINFNLVSLALVNNIISYYTNKHAQEAIVSYAGMPFGLSQINDFMLNQADMAGFAGIVGAASVFAVTPLIFKGETAGFSAAMGALGGAFRGNVEQAGEKALTDYDAQQKLDNEAMTFDGMTEAEAGAWLSKEGFIKPNNMSSIEAYNSMMKNYGQIGAGNAAQALHSGNMPSGSSGNNVDNYIKGSEAQTMQNIGKTSGFGASVDMDSAGSVSFEDGEVSGSMVNNTATDRAEAGFDASLVGAGQAHSQVAKEMGAQEIGSDANALEKLTASARLASKEQLASGDAALDKMFDNNGFGDFNKTAEEHLANVKTQAAEKLMSSAGRGSTVDYDKATAKAFEDGARNGESVNDASDLMLSGAKDKKGRPVYDRDLAAHGEALKEIAGLQADAQTAKAADNKSTGEKNGDVDYIMGAGAKARKDANDLIGIGEKWEDMSDSQQIAEMKKEKENSKVGFFGGIEATNAEIHKHKGGVDGAIEDMVTQAQKKGIESAADSSTLRKNYGNNLENSKDLISQEQKNEAQKQKDEAQKQKDKILSKSSFAVGDNDKMQKLNKQIEDSDKILNNHDSMTLSEQAQAISQQKLDSQLGQAVGIEKNKNAGVSYAQNAEYGEESKQQSTTAKLNAQGGVDKAVALDVESAELKGKTEKNVLDSQLKNAGDKDGLNGSTKELSKAIDKLAQTAGTLAGGKTAADIAGTSKYDSPEQYAEAQAKEASRQASDSKTRMAVDKNADANKELVQKMIEKASNGNPETKKKVMKQLENANLISDVQPNGDFTVATGTNFSDGMAILGAGDMGRNKQVVLGGTSLNVDRDTSGSARVTAISGDSSVLNNDSKKINNTDTQTRELLKTNGGDLQKVADAEKSSDAVKFHANPLNDISEVAALIQSATGMDPETAAYAAGAVGLGGAAALFTNKMTKKPIALKPEQLKNLTPIKNEKGDIVKYETAAGKEIADGKGYLTNGHGKRIESGSIARGMRKIWDSTKSNLPSFQNPMPDETSNISTDKQNDYPTKKTNDVQHNNPLNSDTNSVPKNGETRKFISDGFGGMKPNPDYKAESKVPKFIRGMMEKPGKTAIVGGALLADYEAYEHLTSDGFRQSVSNGISNFGNFMTTDHGPKGGSGQTPGSVGYKGTGGKPSGISLSSAANTALNAAAYLTPIASAVFGSDAGNSSYGGDELQQIMANNKTATTQTGSKTPAWASNITPLTTNGPTAQVPSYAQTAFRTPPMANTIGAMGGTTAYNNSMNQVNTGGPASNKTDTQLQHLDKLSDIDMSNEGIVEAMENLTKYYEGGE